MKYLVVISIEQEVEADSQERAVDEVWIHTLAEGLKSTDVRRVKADAMLRESVADAARRGYSS